MRHILVTCVLFCFAIPASAQITAGPLGPFAVVDDNGKLVGGVADFIEFDFSGGDLPKFWQVALDTPQGAGMVFMFDNTGDGAVDTFAAINAAVFTTGGSDYGHRRYISIALISSMGIITADAARKTTFPTARMPSGVMTMKRTSKFRFTWPAYSLPSPSSAVATSPRSSPRETVQDNVRGKNRW